MKLESFRYLKESRNYIFAIAILEVSSIIIGWTFVNELSPFFHEIFHEIIRQYALKLAAEQPVTWFDEILKIFIQNLKVSFLIEMILGAFLGIMPIVNTIWNGTLIGYVLRLATMKGIWFPLFHAPFELTAIWISAGLGLKLGATICIEKNFWKTLLYRLIHSAVIFLTIPIPLLAVAAIIEVTV